MKALIALILTPLLTLGGLALTAAPASAAATPAEANQVLANVNSIRAESGLPALRLNPDMNWAASIWSDRMAATGVFRHSTGTAYDYRDQIPQGYSSAGENVATGVSLTSATVVNAWRNSATHFDNLVGNYTDMGISVSYSNDGTPYWSQVFANYPGKTTVPGVINQPIKGDAGWSSGVSVKGAPSVEGRPGQLFVSWQAPRVTGNLPVTGYDVVARNNTGDVRTVRVSNTSALIDVLPNSTYSVTVSAYNAVGTGAESAATSRTSLAVPPSNVVATVSDATDATALLTLSANNGGLPIDRWTVTVNDGRTFDVSSNSFTLDGLRRATNVSGTVVAHTTAGSSAPGTFAFTTAASVPSVARNVEATLSGEQDITVTWNTPEDDGGTPITGYQVSITNVNESSTTPSAVLGATARSYTFRGEKGVNYSFAVSALNATGASALSASTAQVVVPKTAPSAARNVSADLTDEQEITVSFRSVADRGGDDDISYDVVLRDVDSNTTLVKTVTTDHSGSLTEVFTAGDGVESDTTYAASVSARNTVGAATAANASSNTVVPRTPTAPDAPTISRVDRTSSALTVYWREPDFNGGAAVDGYQISISSVHGTDQVYVETRSSGSTVHSHTWASLPRATEHTVTVSAVNNRGGSVEASEEAFTLSEDPSTPDAPTLTLLPNSNDIRVDWTAPTDDGGTPIKEYYVSINENGDPLGRGETRRIPGNAALSTVFENLAWGTSYQANVFAINQDDADSELSSMSAAVATEEPPTQVQNLSVVPQDGNLLATWTEPTSAGTYPIEGYNVKVYSVSDQLVSSENVPASNLSNFITGLNPGQEYRVAVYAYSSLDEPQRAVSVNAVFPAIASNPVSNLRSVESIGAVTVEWDAPEYTGGARISAFIVRYGLVGPGGLIGDYTEISTTNSYVELTGLEGRGSYAIEVRVLNEAGLVSVPEGGSFVAPVVPPAGVRNVLAEVEPDTQSLRVTWDGPTSLGGATVDDIAYHVSLIDENGLTVDYAIVSGDDEQEVLFENLVRGENYYASIYVDNSAGASVSVRSTAVTIPFTVPSAITDPQVFLEGLNVVRVIWNLPQDDGGTPITSYRITDQTTGLVYVAAGNAQSLVISDLAPDTLHSFVVEAVNSVGSSGESNSTNTVLTAPGSNPPAPTEEDIANTPGSLVVTDLGDGILQFTLRGATPGEWVYGYLLRNEYTTPSGEVVSQSTVEESGWRLINSNGEVFFFIDTTVLDAGEYTYAVLDSSFNLAGTAGFTVEEAGTPVPPIENPSTPGVDPILPPTTDTSGDTGAPTSESDGKEAATKSDESKKQDELAKTGSTPLGLILLSIILLAVGFTSLLIRRRKIA